MHVLIGLITALGGLLWALHALQRSGLDLGGLNPFAWARRRRWQKLYGSKPIYSLERPMEVAALLIVGVLKEEGEISREQKTAVVEIFRNEFHLSDDQAREAFSASVFLLKDELNLDQSVQGIIEPCRDRFTPDQAESLLGMLERVAAIEGPATEAQRSIIDAVRRELTSAPDHQGRWS